MLIKTHASGFNHPVPSEITPQGIYHGRRDIIKLMATGAAGAAMASWAGRQFEPDAILGGAGVERRLKRFAQALDRSGAFRQRDAVGRDAALVGGQGANRAEEQRQDEATECGRSAAGFHPKTPPSGLVSV